MQHDAAAGVLRLTAWGFWSIEVSLSFEQLAIDARRQEPTTRELVLDMSRLKPLRDEGQRSIAKLLALLPELGITRTTVLTTSQLTKLQLLRIVRESGAKDQVVFADA